MIVLLGVAGRLSEAVVERTHPRSRHMRDQTVEHNPAPLVRIAGGVEKVAQEPAALRDAEGDRVSKRRFPSPEAG